MGSNAELFQEGCQQISILELNLNIYITTSKFFKIKGYNWIKVTPSSLNFYWGICGKFLEVNITSSSHYLCI